MADLQGYAIANKEYVINNVITSKIIAITQSDLPNAKKRALIREVFVSGRKSAR